MRRRTLASVAPLPYIKLEGGLSEMSRIGAVTRIGSVALAVSALVGPASAGQGSRPPAVRGPIAHPAGAPQEPAFLKELGITPAQKQKLDAINKGFADKMKAVREDKSLSEDKRREKAMRLFDEMRKQSDAVLTPQQRQKAKALQQRWLAEARKRGMEEGRRRQAAFAKEIGLTDAQQKKMQAIGDRFRPRFEALQKNTSLTPEQKSQKLRALFVEEQKQREAVLTPAQRQKIKAMRQRRVEESRRREAEFEKELGLTDAQKKKVKAIDDTFRTRLDAVQKDKKLTPQQKGQKVQALFWDMQRQRNALLTPAQRKKAEEIAKRQRQEMLKGIAPAPGGRK